MGEMFLRRLTRWQAEQERESFADTYVEAYAGDAGDEFHDRQAFLRRFEEHVQQTDFGLVVAAEGAERMGCAYGFQVSRSGEWWRNVHQALPSDLEELTASGQVFVLAEVMVLPEYRRRRIATRLKDHLLARSGAARAIAFVGSDNPVAEATFRAWSWSDLGEAGSVPGTAPQRIWSRRLVH